MSVVSEAKAITSQQRLTKRKICCLANNAPEFI
jgi:hypothetical protein